MSLKQKFSIETLWNGNVINHSAVCIEINPMKDYMNVRVYGPFFNTPTAPKGCSGESFNQLWEYEVAELFFLDKVNEEYLETELCPHGQYLVLALKGVRNIVNSLDIKYSARIDKENNTWSGEAEIPWKYFPKSFLYFNAYAIHGEGSNRQYEALYPVPIDNPKNFKEPDFHRLEYFKTLNKTWLKNIEEMFDLQNKSRSAAIYG